jgi:TonB-linked SusC/RagA family outer membrane protein
MITALFAGTKAAAQSVTISEKNVSIEKVLKAIRAQTGYNYVCKGDWVKQIGALTIDMKDATVPEVIRKCLEGKPFSYQIDNTTITIYPVSANTPATAGTFTVTGTVINARNKMLDGASVVLQRTKQGAITDVKGRFSFKNALPTDVLLITFIGYAPQQVAVSGQSEITVILKEASNQLDEIILQGFSKSSERFITGNITRITAKDIEKQPVMNPLLALEGRVPGLSVTATNGFASAPVKMEIRGLNSLNRSIPADPLYVIDGVPLTVLSLGSTFNRISNGYIQNVGYNYPSMSTTNGQSPLFSINPEDIESIEILKDADATAVYGARGSNGVILVTTKKGRPGKLKFDFDFNPPALSFGRTGRRVRMLSTPEYLQMRREALKNDGITPNILNAPDLMLWDTTRQTDWQKELLGNRITNIDISMGLSGGSEQANFRVNARYNRVTNSTDISGATERITVGSNTRLATNDQKFTADLAADFAYSFVNVVVPVVNPFFAPNAPPAYDKDGNPNWAEWNADGLMNLYPFGNNLAPANPQATTTLTSSLNLQYKPFKGLVLNAILGYNFAYNSTQHFITIASQNPYGNNIKGAAAFSTTQNAGWTINPQITYNTRISRGKLQLTMVATEQAVATNGVHLFGENYENDIFLKSISNAGRIYTEAASAKAKNASFIGGINYNWDDKYIINLNGARQGSSKFGPDNKYGSFGSVGLAWIASEEKWLKLPSLVSFLKFRGSYGLTGSDNIADYQYLALWRIQNYGGSGGYNEEMVLTPSVRPNQRYRWENNRKLEAAVNIGLLQDKLAINLSWYRNRVSNQLTSYPTPGFLNGYEINSILTNVPMLMQNSGWEAYLSAQLVNSKNFSLSARLIFSANRNLLLEFPNLDKTPYAGQYEVGRSINTAYVFHYLGVDPLTGKGIFQDFNHDGVISSNYMQVSPPGSDDRGIVLDLQPAFDGGFGFEGNYKRLRFSIDFTFRKQIAPNLYYQFAANAGKFNQNIPYSAELIDNRWRKPGDIATYPAATTGVRGDNPWAYIAQSDFAFTDGSYIRLNNVHIAYPLPEAWVRKIRLKNLAVSLSAHNLFTISPYKGLDPQALEVIGMPASSLYTVRFSYDF